MTNDPAADGKMTKNQRREAAREKARQLREEQKKKDRRNKIFLQGGIAVLVLAIAALVTVIIVSTVRPPGPGPLNMISDGIRIGQDLKAERTAALAAGEKPVAHPVDETNPVLDIRIYVDYHCPHCGDFENANGDQLRELVESGKATLEIHPISIMDRASSGTRYASRAANAAACVANYAPDSFFDFNDLMFANQPGADGLTDEQIVQLASQAGATSPSIEACVTGGEFRAWVRAATDRVTGEVIPYSTQPAFTGTPMIIVNGQHYTDSHDPQVFRNFLLKLQNELTPAPEPEPSASPES